MKQQVRNPARCTLAHAQCSLWPCAHATLHRTLGSCPGLAAFLPPTRPPPTPLPNPDPTANPHAASRRPQPPTCHIHTPRIASAYQHQTHPPYARLLLLSQATQETAANCFSSMIAATPPHLSASTTIQPRTDSSQCSSINKAGMQTPIQEPVMPRRWSACPGIVHAIVKTRTSPQQPARCIFCVPQPKNVAALLYANTCRPRAQQKKSVHMHVLSAAQLPRRKGVAPCWHQTKSYPYHAVPGPRSLCTPPHVRPVTRGQHHYSTTGDYSQPAEKGKSTCHIPTVRPAARHSPSHTVTLLTRSFLHASRIMVHRATRVSKRRCIIVLCITAMSSCRPRSPAFTIPPHNPKPAHAPLPRPGATYLSCAAHAHTPLVPIPISSSHHAVCCTARLTLHPALLLLLLLLLPLPRPAAAFSRAAHSQPLRCCS